MSSIIIEPRFAGPPNMGHGGYVAGLFAEHLAGPVQATLRRPIPIDAPLDMVRVGDVWELRHGDEAIATGESAPLDLDVPDAPSLDAARAAEAGSPSFLNGRGVHPTCFGCGMENVDGLRIAAGPVEDGSQVAAVWTPEARFADAKGVVRARFVVAALDCAGAFAYLVDDIKAGLLGRIVVEQHAPVLAGEPHVVTGWRIEVDGKKMFAGTALTAEDGSVLAAARATWFGWG